MAGEEVLYRTARFPLMAVSRTSVGSISFLIIIPFFKGPKGGTFSLWKIWIRNRPLDSSATKLDATVASLLRERVYDDMNVVELTCYCWRVVIFLVIRPHNVNNVISNVSLLYLAVTACTMGTQYLMNLLWIRCIGRHACYFVENDLHNLYQDPREEINVTEHRRAGRRLVTHRVRHIQGQHNTAQFSQWWVFYPSRPWNRYASQDQPTQLVSPMPLFRPVVLSIPAQPQNQSRAMSSYHFEICCADPPDLLWRIWAQFSGTLVWRDGLVLFQCKHASTR